MSIINKKLNGKRVEKDKFEKWVMEAMELLPAIFRKKLQNITIIIADVPSKQLSKQYPNQLPLIYLGLYQGVPLTKKRIYHPYVFPDKIMVFRQSIEKLCSSEKQMREMVIKTVFHEIGHYFGLSEKELKEE